ncbi:MAG TPA: TlpA disulfide reductase family protein [Terriglobales bacterium]
MKRLFRPSTLGTLAVLAVLLGASAVAVDQSGARVDLKEPSTRKAAPQFTLQDSSGKTARLTEYHGKVVVLDFWATWCHGCKEEIPWFAEFDRKYGTQGLAVIGVSMDDDGWKVVTPFIKSADVPYRIVLGNQKTGKDYGISNMPDTFLIDREGRIAAAYSGMVNRDDLEKNITAVLKEN